MRRGLANSDGNIDGIGCSAGGRRLTLSRFAIRLLQLIHLDFLWSYIWSWSGV